MIRTVSISVEGVPTCAFSPQILIYPSDNQIDKNQTPAQPPHFRRLLPFEDPEDTETCNIIVMEVRDLKIWECDLRSGV
jgi:hypothetical protein